MIVPTFLNAYYESEGETDQPLLLIDQHIDIHTLPGTLRNEISASSFHNYKVNYKESVLRSLVTDYINDFQSKSDHFSGIQPRLLHGVFVACAEKLLKLNPDSIGIELTISKSFFFVSKFGEITSHLELFLDEENLPKLLAVSNIYRQKEHILADSGSLEKAIAQLKELVPESTAHYLKRLQSEYALSGSTFTEQTV